MQNLFIYLAYAFSQAIASIIIPFPVKVGVFAFINNVALIIASLLLSNAIVTWSTEISLNSVC